MGYCVEFGLPLWATTQSCVLFAALIGVFSGWCFLFLQLITRPTSKPTKPILPIPHSTPPLSPYTSDILYSIFYILTCRTYGSTSCLAHQASCPERILTTSWCSRWRAPHATCWSRPPLSLWRSCALCLLYQRSLCAGKDVGHAGQTVFNVLYTGERVVMRPN